MSIVPSITDIAYLAGIIDGEGSILICKDNRDGRMWGYIRLYNTSEELMVWIEERFGGKFYENPPRGLGVKPIFMLDWNGRESRELLPELIPFLLIKKEKARNLYDFTLASDYHSTRGNNKGMQEACYEMSRALR